MSVLTITAPIFALIALGYLVVSMGWVTREANRGMGAFVIYCALPALIFRALSGQSIEKVLNFHYLAGFGIGSLAALLLGFGIAYSVRQKPLDSAAFQGLGGSMANSGFIGYAIVIQLFGAIAVIGVALSMLIDLLLLVPITIGLAELAQHQSASARHAVSQAFKRTITNPLVIAIAAGLIASLFNWQLTGPAKKVLDILADSAAAVSLFVIGGTLVGQTLRGQLKDIAQMTSVKLIGQPVAVAFAIWLLPPFDPTFQATAIILAAMPMAGVLPLIAQRYNQQAICATALVSATLFSFVTINILLWILQLSGLLAI
ncbi:MAG: AEC family transporter [Chromatiales bacterium]|nr:AEC family transporter [Chromatiales bacterium]